MIKQLFAGLLFTMIDLIEYLSTRSLRHINTFSFTFLHTTFTCLIFFCNTYAYFFRFRLCKLLAFFQWSSRRFLALQYLFSYCSDLCLSVLAASSRFLIACSFYFNYSPGNLRPPFSGSSNAFCVVVRFLLFRGLVCLFCRHFLMFFDFIYFCMISHHQFSSNWPLTRSIMLLSICFTIFMHGLIFVLLFYILALYDFFSEIRVWLSFVS